MDGACATELRPGSELLHGQYTVQHFLGSGGFGMTYLASDSLNRSVVIKECFPQAVCERQGSRVCSRSPQEIHQFKAIVRHFVREAHRLARLDHPNIVGVHQVFEDNETAYMALDFVDGPDLVDRLDQPGTLSPDHVKSLLLTLLDAVQFTHANGLLHCDISPDNILMDQTGRPVLIDFGAARENRTAEGRAVSSLLVVKDGYSPQEFYLTGGEQGPFSDLYALGATFYHLIAGARPPNSQERIGALASDRPDPYVPLGQLELPDGYYAPEFSAAIDKALRLRPAERFQSAEDWMLAIDPAKRRERAAEQAQSDEGMVEVIRQTVAQSSIAPEEPAPVQVAQATIAQAPVATPPPVPIAPERRSRWALLWRVFGLSPRNFSN